MHRITRLLLIMMLVASCSAGAPGRTISVITHPDGPLYVGDQVSFEVLDSSTIGGGLKSVGVSFQGQTIGDADFGPMGLGGREQATLWWVWDTSKLKPSNYTLTFTVYPGPISVRKTFSLHLADQVPAPEPGAKWTTTSTVCCLLHYITGTAAARDIAGISQLADKESEIVSGQIGASLNRQIDIVFMPRVIGHGGFTTTMVYVSYLDNDYIGNDMTILFHHEFVHYYDGLRPGEFKPILFEEGLAVYLTGGHFKVEPIIPRAAAMLALGWYIPLRTLSNDFYNQQHEIGYLEAAALVGYLVEKYGWSAFNDFYLNIPNPNNSQKVADAIDAALQEHFNISLEQLESSYQAFLRSRSFTEADRADLQATVKFYDTARRYQQVLDPSAYFLTAWLPNGAEMISRGIVADFLRRPEAWDNRLVENLLIRAQQAYLGGNYQNAESTLWWTNVMLDVFAH
jgi:hypothetical protein